MSATHFSSSTRQTRALTSGFCWLLCLLLVAEAATGQKTDPSGRIGSHKISGKKWDPSANLSMPDINIRRDNQLATLELDFDDDFFEMGENLEGPVGYRVSWRALEGDDTSYKQFVTSLREVQIQPLLNDAPYIVRAEYINRFGKRVGFARFKRFMGGDGSRVELLREQMTGFFEPFDQPAGLPDERKWNTSFSRVNDPTLGAFFVNAQFHGHTLVGTPGIGFGDRGQTVHRIRKPMKLGAGETRRIVFDLDGAFVGGRAIWYLDILPQQSDINSHISPFESDDSFGSPSGGIRFGLERQELSLWVLDGSGRQRRIDKVDSLESFGLRMTPNVRRPMEVLLSENNVELFIDGIRVLDTPLGGDALEPTDYTIQWNLFGYNTMKQSMPYSIVHWDNFGFDGPGSDEVVHNYRARIFDTDYVTSYDYTPARVEVEIPDNLNPVGEGVAEARLYFTHQMTEWREAKWSNLDRIIVNGQAFSIPEPTSNTSPSLRIDQLVNSNAPYSNSISLGTVGENGTSPLVQGTNEIVFESESCGFLNVHIEVTYENGTEPVYTPPEQIHFAPKHHDFIKVGLPARISKIGTSPVDSGRWYQNDIENFNMTISGAVDVEVLVNASQESVGETRLRKDFVSPQLAGSGTNPGIQWVELYLRPDDGDSSTAVSLGLVKTSSLACAPQFFHKFEFNTTQFPNGVYELTMLAEDGRGILSIPDFGSVGQQAILPENLNGMYFPLHVTIFN